MFKCNDGKAFLTILSLTFNASFKVLFSHSIFFITTSPKGDVSAIGRKVEGTALNTRIGKRCEVFC